MTTKNLPAGTGKPPKAHAKTGKYKLPKPKKSFMAMPFLEEQLLKSISIDIGGVTKKHSPAEIILMRLVSKAKQGDLKVIEYLLKETKVLEKLRDNAGPTTTPEETAWVDKLFSGIKRSNGDIGA